MTTNNADRRSVATDALETLGMKIDAAQKRDAIHLAVEPVVAAVKLYPGQHIGLLPDGHATNDPSIKKLGIVDPFVPDPIWPGERFWLVVYPRQISSLRHVWTHPDFAASPDLADLEKPEVGSNTAARKWIDDYARQFGITGDRLIEAATEYLDEGEYLIDGGRFEGEAISQDFWPYYEIATGREVAQSERHSFLSCSC